MKIKKLLLLLMTTLIFTLSACGESEDYSLSNEVAEEFEEEIQEEVISVEEQEEVLATLPEGYTINEMTMAKYSSTELNVRDLPNKDGNKIGGLSTNEEVVVIGECEETGWYQIEYNGGIGYVSNVYLVDEIQQVETQVESVVEELPANKEEVAAPVDVQENPVSEPSNTAPEQVVFDNSSENSTSGDTAGVTVPSQDQAVANGVWVPTQGGTKYHSSPGCSNMENPIQVSLDTATANGYTACKRCH